MHPVTFSSHSLISFPALPVLLNIVEEILPIGMEQWAIVVSRFNHSIGSNRPQRDLESLRGKFRALETKKKPTGAQWV